MRVKWLKQESNSNKFSVPIDGTKNNDRKEFFEIDCQKYMNIVAKKNYMYIIIGI